MACVERLDFSGDGSGVILVPCGSPLVSPSPSLGLGSLSGGVSGWSRAAVERPSPTGWLSDPFFPDVISDASESPGEPAPTVTVTHQEVQPAPTVTVTHQEVQPAAVSEWTPEAVGVVTTALVVLVMLVAIVAVGSWRR